MRFDIVTLFPDMCMEVLSTSILKRAQELGKMEAHVTDPREFAKDKHRSVDDTPYGGGTGMVLKVDVFDEAIQSVKDNIKTENTNLRTRSVLLTPQGRTFNQEIAREFASNYDQITFVCGHYEGFDERIRGLVDEEISIGEYVLTGGELPALSIIDAVTRLLPGVLPEGVTDSESHSLKDENNNILLEYPQYTRPVDYKGQKVPEVLLSGNHAQIAKWRLEQAKIKTQKQAK